MAEQRDRTTSQALMDRRSAGGRCAAVLRHEFGHCSPPKLPDADGGTPERSAGDDGACHRTAPDACLYCSGRALHRWGATTRGRQRWRCRTCWRTFTATSGTALSRLHEPAAFAAVADDMMATVPRSCRALGRDLAVDRMTIWRWRHKIATALADAQTPIMAEDVETTSIILRESRKASREWVDHAQAPHRYPAPNRLRWIDYRLLQRPLPMPMAPFLVPVTLTIDWRHDCRATAPFPAAAVFSSPAMAPDAAVERPAPPDGSPGPTRETVPRRDTVSAPARASACERFATFVAPFCGPATRHLRGYAAWFTARERGPAESGPPAAWARLTE